jgi:crotonobetainyl-CoA:carnitine CoA-transferase CaiB-like acyl-CoA transferase
VGRPELAEDPRFVTNGDRITNQRELTEILNGIFMQHDRAYWDDVLYEANVPAGPINDLFQALEHPQAKHRESIMFLEHGVGTRTPSIRSPLRLSETPVTYRAGPPVTGQHTLEVLTKVTGLSEEKLIELESLGVIQQFKRK